MISIMFRIRTGTLDQDQDKDLISGSEPVSEHKFRNKFWIGKKIKIRILIRTSY